MTPKMAVFFIFWKWPIYFTIYYRIWAQKVCSHARCKVPPFTCFSGYLLRVLFYSFRMWVQDSHFSFNLNFSFSSIHESRAHVHVFSSSIQMSRISGFDVFNIISIFSSQSRPISNSISTRSTGPCMCPRALSKLTFSSNYTHYHVWKLKLLECQPLI